jgi:hypothetical protein
MDRVGQEIRQFLPSLPKTSWESWDGGAVVVGLLHELL